MGGLTWPVEFGHQDGLQQVVWGGRLIAAEIALEVRGIGDYARNVLDARAHA